MPKKELYQMAQSSRKESKRLDFKECFDSKSGQQWCEIVKDIVAMANSGGGVLLFGVRDDGTLSDFDCASFLALDPAQITDKVSKYTGVQFADFEIREVDRDGEKVAALFIGEAATPIVFSVPGTFPTENGKQQQVAFSRGTVYFRHGAKSDPGNTHDVRDAIERAASRMRKSLLGGIRKVVEAPSGYKVEVLPPEITLSSQPTAAPIRIVNDPNAPSFRIVVPDDTFPFRLKEATKQINSTLAPEMAITSYDVQSIRAVYNADQNPQYVHKPRFSSPQYSQLFVDWIVEQIRKDTSFCKKAREVHKQGAAS